MAAIVNTLTSFDNINGVLFVSMVKKVPTVGSFDTKDPVKRMTNLIKKIIPLRETLIADS